jgi:hypothetical protein
MNLNLTIRYWTKWAMLQKIRLLNADFHDLATRWGIGIAGKAIMVGHYTNFLRQILSRIDSVLNAWIETHRTNFHGNRRLTAIKVRAMCDTADKIRRMWVTDRYSG